MSHRDTNPNNLTYLIIRLDDIEDAFELPNGYWNNEQKSASDCLVWSLKYTRYSYNVLEKLGHIFPISYVCDTQADFIAYVTASQLNVDLSNLMGTQDVSEILNRSRRNQTERSD